MGKATICVILYLYYLPLLNNVGEQRVKLASSHLMGSQHGIEKEGDI